MTNWRNKKVGYSETDIKRKKFGKRKGEIKKIVTKTKTAQAPRNKDSQVTKEVQRPGKKKKTKVSWREGAGPASALFASVVSAAVLKPFKKKN